MLSWPSDQFPASVFSSQEQNSDCRRLAWLAAGPSPTEQAGELPEHTRRRPPSGPKVLRARVAAAGRQLGMAGRRRTDGSVQVTRRHQRTGRRPTTREPCHRHRTAPHPARTHAHTPAAAAGRRPARLSTHTAAIQTALPRTDRPASQVPHPPPVPTLPPARAHPCTASASWRVGGTALAHCRQAGRPAAAHRRAAVGSGGHTISGVGGGSWRAAAGAVYTWRRLAACRGRPSALSACRLHMARPPPALRYTGSGPPLAKWMAAYVAVTATVPLCKRHGRQRHL